MTPDGIELSIIGPALLAGVLVVATHVPMGQQVLARGIVFIDLAIAQIAGLGVIAAHAFGWELQGWQTQAAAAGAAVLGAMLLTWSEKRWPETQEALIGVSFVVAACAGILLLSDNPHGGEHLKDLLVGQILWVLPHDLVPVMILYTAVLALWFGMQRRIGRIGFYLLFAVTVTASVQLVGIYLVFASLIIPALATRDLPPGPQLAQGYGIGVSAYGCGLLVSALYDLPAGAVVVCTLALTAMVIATLRRWLAGVRGPG